MNIDPRANSSERIVPPSPLPHVSRRALKRVTNPMPPPTSCPSCGGEVKLVSNSVVYKGREYGDWPYMYDCRLCDAYVGLHPDTDIPLGTMAVKALREARKSSKAVFIKMYESKTWTRKTAYAWLAKELGIDAGECHFGWFNELDCQRASVLCNSEISKTRM